MYGEKEYNVKVKVELQFNGIKRDVKFIELHVGTVNSTKSDWMKSVKRFRDLCSSSAFTADLTFCKRNNNHCRSPYSGESR